MYLQDLEHTEMAPLCHHVHHFRTTRTVKHFRRETRRTPNGVRGCPKAVWALQKQGARLHKRAPSQKCCGCDTTTCQSLHMTAQLYAPFGYWQGVPPMCLTDVSTHAGQKARLSRKPDTGTVLVLEMPSPPAGCLPWQSSHQSTSRCQQPWATVKPRDFSEMARWWKCCNAFYVAFIPQSL